MKKRRPCNKVTLRRLWRSVAVDYRLYEEYQPEQLGRPPNWEGDGTKPHWTRFITPSNNCWHDLVEKNPLTQDQIKKLLVEVARSLQVKKNKNIFPDIKDLLAQDKAWSAEEKAALVRLAEDCMDYLEQENFRTDIIESISGTYADLLVILQAVDNLRG